ncbi:AAA family ATPase, partial [Candidatus Micrarchaeota archaeon]|nr:AAA family ATPase [Candidatus Micrarchaeota archaeon]
LAKHILNQLKEATNRVHCIRINCMENAYRYAALTAILTSLGYAISRRGRSADEVIQYIVEFLKKEKKTPVIILDDIDMLVSEEKNAILYDFLRMKENFGIDSVVIAITNREDFIMRLDRRVRSSLLQSVLKFHSYSPQQLKDILRERAKLGFFPETWDDEVIGLCAGFAAKNGGDARLGINTLWLAAKEAEKSDSKKITVEHVGKIKKDAQTLLKSEREQNLSREEKLVLEEIRKAGQIQSGDLYSRIKINERSVRNYLSKLEELGLIQSIQINSKEGNTRIFSPKAQ